MNKPDMGTQMPDEGMSLAAMAPVCVIVWCVGVVVGYAWKILT